MKNYFSLPFLLLSSFMMMAQSPEIDSLQNLLSKEQTDTGRINIINLISREYINTGDNKSALQFAKTAQERSVLIDYKKGVAVSYNNIGIVYTIQTDYAKALENYFLALKFGEESGDKIILVKTYNNIGIVYDRQSDFDKAVSSYLSSLKISEEIKDWKGVSVLYQNIGNIYSDSEEYETALTYFNKSLTICKALNDASGEGGIYNSITTAYARLGKYNKALEVSEKALVINKQISDKYQTAATLSNISEIYVKIKEYDKALMHLREALSLAVEMDDKSRQGNYHNGLGEIYMGLNDFKGSYRHLDTALNLGKSIDNKSMLKDSYKILSDLYMKMNDCKKSYDCYLLYISYKDSVNSTEGALEMERMQSKYESDKKEKIRELEQATKDEKQKAKLDKERMMRYGFMGGFALMIALSFFIYKGYRQKIKSNLIISEQKKIVEVKNHEITDSIKYASRVQQAILPPADFLNDMMPEHFIYFSPKDIVSGDFYFADKQGDKLFWASCDSTGHGASGALLSMLGSNILSGIVKDGEAVPSKILDKLNERINQSLHKTSDESIRDGMDVSFCCLDTTLNKLCWAGANNPLWMVRGGEIIEWKGDKMPIGQMYKTENYKNHEIEVQTRDTIYSFSDGYVDQFNRDGKKFMKKRFRELLLSIRDKSMSEQKEIISSTMNDWRSGGTVEQTDDLLIFGVKV